MSIAILNLNETLLAEILLETPEFVDAIAAELLQTPDFIESIAVELPQIPDFIESIAVELPQISDFINNVGLELNQNTLFVDGITTEVLSELNLEVIVNPANSLAIVPRATPQDPTQIGITIQASPSGDITVAPPSVGNEGIWTIGSSSNLNPGTMPVTQVELRWKYSLNPGTFYNLFVPIAFTKLNKVVTVTVGNNGGNLAQTFFPVDGPPNPPNLLPVTIDSNDTPIQFPDPSWLPDPTILGGRISIIIEAQQNVYNANSRIADFKFVVTGGGAWSIELIPLDVFNSSIWTPASLITTPADIWHMPQFSFTYVCTS